MEKYITKWPLTISGGNHEDNHNFTFFNSKFKMIGYEETENFYYSYNVGLVHFISLNLEWYGMTTNENKIKMF